jgi:hypothetical protein
VREDCSASESEDPLADLGRKGKTLSVSHDVDVDGEAACGEPELGGVETVSVRFGDE